MPVPSLITDLSQTAGSNYPSGGDTPSTLDDVQRAHGSFIAQLRDGKGFTNAVTLASASTTDIGAQNSMFVDVSGTTTITSFGTSYNGPRFVRFTGALTLTHNATSLILPTGANITTVAGDSCIAFPNAALNGWTVVAYAGKSGQFSTLNASGNLAFSSTGNRITGDFSNATVANRVMFQPSAANSNGEVSCLPSGTGNIMSWTAFAGSDPANAQFARMQALGGSEMRFVSSYAGTPTSGTYLPMTFYTGGSERMRIDTSGNVGVGVAPVALNKFIAQADTSDATTNAIRANNSAGTPVFIVGGNGQALVLAPAALGYGTGAGGTVTQATSKGTTVTLNRPTGQITMNNAALGAGATITFQFNNSLIAATDTLLLSFNAGATWAGIGSYSCRAACGSGAAIIAVKNESAGSLSEAVILNFAIIKGATA